MSQPKTIYVLILPEHGHLNPVASVIHEMIKTNKNLNVIFYGTENFKSLIERTGATYRQYTYYPDETYQQTSLEQKKSFIEWNFLSNLLFRVVDFCDKILPDLIADAEREKPDLIIYDVFALQAKYLLRSLELRHKRKISTLEPPKAIMFATTFAQRIGVFPTVKDLLSIFQINLSFFFQLIVLICLQLKFSYKHGLDIVNVVHFLTNQTEELVITTIFPEFQPFREKFDASFNFVGSCIAENVRNFEVKDPRLQSCIDMFEPVNPLQSIEDRTDRKQKLVYFSLGTVFNNNMTVFETVINTFESLRDSENVRLVISTGKDVYEYFENKVRKEKYRIPDNVILQPSVPQIEILKRASLFITHAGMNSAMETISYAVPVLCIPMAADQPLVANRMAELKMGKVIQPLELKADNFRNAVDEILNDQSYLERMIYFSKKSRECNGNKNGARLIIDFLNEKKIQ